MAIYGDFANHAFPDVMKVLQKHTGTLFLQSALGGRSVELHLYRGELRGLFMDGFPVREELRVQDILRQLMNHATGPYEFEATHPHQLTNHFVLPLEQALRSMIQDARIDESQLPHESTRFVAVQGADNYAASLPYSLQNAWYSLSHIFGQQGGSASDISQAAFISLDEARLMLFRLRAAGMITPFRAAGSVTGSGSGAHFSGAAAPSQAAAEGYGQGYGQASTPEPQRQSPMRRFLNALKRLTGGA